jgi:hypothetical protein
VRLARLLTTQLVLVAAAPAAAAVTAPAAGVERPSAAPAAPRPPAAAPREPTASTLAGRLTMLRRAARIGARGPLLSSAAVAPEAAARPPDAGVEALTRAGGRAPRNPRPDWFLARTLCAMGSAEGMHHFDAADARRGRWPMPALFWKELLRCAVASGMPAHAVRAGRELARQEAMTPADAALVEDARTLLRDPDPAGELAPEEAWARSGAGARSRLASRPCGFALPGRLSWSTPPVREGNCATAAPIGPFPGVAVDVAPRIFVVGHVAEPDESLEAFIGRFPMLHDVRPADRWPCPARGCRAFEGASPDDHAAEGGGLRVVVAFEREEPETRGESVEAPQPAIVTRDGQVHPVDAPPRYVRFPGRLLYLVVLDAPRSVAEPAAVELRRLLGELAVE